MQATSYTESKTLLNPAMLITHGPILKNKWDLVLLADHHFP
jgi:hypothetical protein